MAKGAPESSDQDTIRSMEQKKHAVSKALTLSQVKAAVERSKDWFADYMLRETESMRTGQPIKPPKP